MLHPNDDFQATITNWGWGPMARLQAKTEKLQQARVQLHNTYCDGMPEWVELIENVLQKRINKLLKKYQKLNAKREAYTMIWDIYVKTNG